METFEKKITRMNRTLALVAFVTIGSLALNLTQWGAQSQLIESTSNRVTTIQFDIQSIQGQLAQMQRQANAR